MAKVVHEYAPSGSHRLIVNGKPGGWAGYQGIAEHGDLRAASPYWNGTFPDVFVVVEVNHVEKTPKAATR